MNEPDYDEMMEARAEKAREHLGISADQQPNVDSLLKRLAYIGIIRDISVVPDSSMGASAAAFESTEGLIYLSDSVQEAAKQNDAEARYILAHEASHAMQGHSHTRHFKKGKYQVGRHIEQDEQDAHALALAILAPYSQARLSLTTTAAEIADHFNLSSDHADERHATLMRMYRKRNGIRRSPPTHISPLTAGDVNEHEFADAMRFWYETS